ncbi:acetyl-CoA carboxylase carboxyltransferase subunit beta [Fructilactobacillus florum]|uniref:acetyl-CoA carboxylase carboxyltransferase subunit beta n=1 Tax=Fructilactobacillus florum TaxID=640331 RepID=UPI00028D430E|nr:acetyl-CoA carboxylase carboxyltransferase subunit beta [Fructilactobacillus florum]EKK20384.1 Acetyl-coenzyme A carboxyl transferase beta chain [Fructilactobacillus florum 2F]
MTEDNQSQPTREELQHRMDQIPDVWVKCPFCGKTIYKQQLGQFKECPNCNYAFRLGAHDRIALLCSDFTPLNRNLKVGSRFSEKHYQAKLQQAQATTGLNEAVLTGIGTIDTHRVAIGVMDWRFIMGSLGTVTGELIAQLFETATQQHLPVILFTASGGARMQEGINSLMQMAKVATTIAEHSKQGGLYISYLCDPTTGGVTASFAMEGDLLLSEPHALIGFAGRRVIERTIQQRPPRDFQRAETLLHNGFLDAIVRRSEMKTTLSRILTMHESGVSND